LFPFTVLYLLQNRQIKSNFAGGTMNKNRVRLLAVFIFSVLILAACSQIIPEPSVSDDLQQEKVSLANPAAGYCGGLGYKLEMVERNGGMDADCIFTDGSRCGQWDFLSGRCGQKNSYCEINGGVLDEGNNIGTCIFPDGSSCEEFSYFSGQCKPGDHPSPEGDQGG
jgi:putative hemolysin